MSEPAPAARRPRAVLLDVDGTLVDSNDAHAASWADVFRELGYDRGFRDVRPLVGMGGDRVVCRLLDIDAESEEGKRLLARRRERFLRDYAPSLRPLVGARELLDRLRRDGYRLVIATAAQREELEAILRATGLEGVADEETSSSDAEESKPAPDVVEAAVERAGVDADECVMLGDTPYDVRAATAAGVPLIGFRSGGWDADQLRGAIAIYDGPAELLRRYDESPLGRWR